VRSASSSSIVLNVPQRIDGAAGPGGPALHSRVRALRSRMRVALVTAVLLVVSARHAGSSELRGQVTFSSLPVPGSTITATQRDASRVTVTDEQGGYRFADLADGAWTVEVAMLGFSTIRQDVVVSADAPLAPFTLTPLPVDQIAAGKVVRNEPAAPATAASNSGGGFERAAVTKS